jgi:Ca-activated chloride channel family protein
MDFAQPHWLFIGLLACIGLVLLFRFMQKRRQAALAKFAAHQLIDRLTRNVSWNRRRYKNILLLLAVFMCFAALARPQYGFQWVDVKRKGIDLLFALDTSKSMLAEDIKPNRLKRAHLAILDFVQQLEGDRVGLLPFAGSAYLMCPLTLDYEAFEDSLSAVNTDIIPRGGTNIATVIDKAVETLNNAANHKILIILTDGENLEDNAIKAAEEAARQGLTIYTVGVGTSEGELIPVTEESGKGFIKDRQGNFVTSRLDDKTLTAIAEKSNGLYVPLGSGGEGLETIYQQKLALIPREELAERRHKLPIDRFEWPLAAALFFLILELLIGERKKARPLSFFNTIRRRFKKAKKVPEVTALILFLALITGTGTEAYCSRGEEAFDRGDYLQASEYYRQRLEKSPNDPELQYNFGTAAYKNNMQDDAIEAFTRALKSDNVELQKKAYYNRGNSYYQKGAEVQQADPETTLDQWKQAVSSLQSALQLDPDDADARHNLEVIREQLEKLEEQQQNQQDQQDKKDQQSEPNKEGQPQQDENGQQDSQEKQQSKDGQPENAPETGQNEPGDEQPQSRSEENDNGAPDKPAAINESEEKDKNPEKQANQDAQRQQPGKMTKEEAESLLNALKNEEGELNFVPSDSASGNNNDIDKDW